jgi:hypothetical protein
VGYTEAAVSANTSVAANTQKVGYTEAAVSANTSVAANTQKVGYTEAAVSANTSVAANTQKVGYTEAAVSANTSVAANTQKVGFSDALVNANSSVAGNSALTSSHATTIASHATLHGQHTASLALKAADADVMKKVGNQSISGVKTFSNSVADSIITTHSGPDGDIHMYGGNVLQFTRPAASYIRCSDGAGYLTIQTGGANAAQFKSDQSFETMGAVLYKTASKTADYTVDSGSGKETVIFCDSTSGDIDVTLPSAELGRKIVVIKTVDANDLTVNEGGSGIDQLADRGRMTFYSNGTNWFKG